jgi:hypothetical protein
VVLLTNYSAMWMLNLVHPGHFPVKFRELRIGGIVGTCDVGDDGVVLVVLDMHHSRSTLLLTAHQEKHVPQRLDRDLYGFRLRAQRAVRPNAV